MVRRYCGSGRAVLLAVLGLVSACSSSSGPIDSTDAGAGNATATPTPTASAATPTPTPTPASSAVYDASIGNGVDSAGYANLPLRSGAHRYFVSSSSGSDGNGCTGGQQPGTPLASIAAALNCVADGSGDQILVAQGTSYAAGLPNMTGKSGFSPVYPTVIETYDPADPLNEAKYGRATGGNRPVLNTGGAASQMVTMGGGTSPKYLAIRGFDFNPGNKPDMRVVFLPNTTGSTDYVLIEHNIFRYSMLSFDQAGSATPANHLVVRGNSSYGQWSAASFTQGLYLANWASYTIEDNVFYHNGWKIGASRTDLQASGGAIVFNHPIYAQDNTSGTARRNLIIDGSNDGGSFRGNITFTENVGIDNPTAVLLGGGSDYNIAQPNGVAIQASYNAMLGSAPIPGAGAYGGWGIDAVNGASGSAVHHNLLARSATATQSAPAFLMEANFNQPSYADWSNNVVYLWTTSGNTINSPSAQAFPSQIHGTYNNNIWDDAASGTNASNTTAAFPNPYTAAQLYAALGCSDKVTCATQMIETPEQGWGPKVRALLWSGYAMP